MEVRISDREYFFANVLMPKLFWAHFNAGTLDLFEESFGRYKSTLDTFAFIRTSDYNGFRSFLRDNRTWYGEEFEKLAAMPPQMIDYVLYRTREERLGCPGLVPFDFD